MPFTLQIRSEDEKFKERFDKKSKAIERANTIIDAGTIIKATRHGPAATYVPEKVWITRMPRGNVIWQRLPDTFKLNEAEELITIKHIWDGVEEARLLKIEDDKRYEKKRQWRVERGLE